MIFTTFRRDGAPRLGLVDGDSVIDLNEACPAVSPSLRVALEQGTDLADVALMVLTGNPARIPFAECAFAPLMPEPRKIVCLGLNYYDHAKEGGREKPQYPWFFLRTSTSLMGHEQPALMPKVSEHLDYEAELAVVIRGRVPRHVPRAKALDHVFGYSCFNDISVRDFQKRTPQWTIGKNFDATGGFGPVLVTADALPSGAAGLRIQCRLNDQVMQDANTSDMIFDVAETIHLLSEAMTLEPGDVIVMGTPAGVGMARTPPVWMRAGDVVHVEIEGIGTLSNPVRAEA
jgi:2-keto-4-pentenoate hydratase/2-oxohepta-3-ene-1,7-dioic acid hydratase in catechol pathway